MAERLLAGMPASPGVTFGRGWRLNDDVLAQDAVREPELELASALSALEATVRELHALASGLSDAEAEIIETSAMMGQDPVLLEAIERAILSDGATAVEAVLHATAQHAAAIAALEDETLAARADDVHSLGRRAARLAAGRQQSAPPGVDLILIADDLGPADVAEFAPALSGIALGAGAATSHAAIVARSLGIPMVVGLHEGTRELRNGDPLVIDGSDGTLVVRPSPDRTRHARAELFARRTAAERARELRDEPAVTDDGTRIIVLANVASREELEVGLAAGAEGIGLLRTELAFLQAADWPSEHEHHHAVESILRGLDGHNAVVRVLDFGADKAPPFLRDVPQRGISLLLAHREEFCSQLRALVRLGQHHDLRLLLPMVETCDQLSQTHDLLARVAEDLGLPAPPLGCMIETPLAVRNVREIAQLSAFLSVGTNDLTASTLGTDRFAANSSCSHHPLVLRAIADSVAAAHDAGIRLEVCGEAASDAIMLPLLVGLGVDELSVGAARVGEVRAWIRRLNSLEVASVAHSALTMGTPEEVEWTVRPFLVERPLAHRE